MGYARFVEKLTAKSGFKSVMGNEYCGMSMSGVGCTLIEAKELQDRRVGEDGCLKG